MNLEYLINPLLIICGILFIGSLAVLAFMSIFEAGYDAGYQSGKRNFKHGLYGDSNVIKN